MLYQPVDTIQSGIADKWLQEWQNSCSVWSLCVTVCLQNEKQYYSIFMLNTMIKYRYWLFIIIVTCVAPIQCFLLKIKSRLLMIYFP